MKIFLLVTIGFGWLVTLMFAYESRRRGSGGPSIGPGLGAAIAFVIAIGGAALSLGLAVVLFVRYDTRWPLVSCLASAPLAWLPASVARWRRR
jgi:hypothetical protein